MCPSTQDACQSLCTASPPQECNKRVYAAYHQQSYSFTASPCTLVVLSTANRQQVARLPCIRYWLGG
jgi:hypothetical protein